MIWLLTKHKKLNKNSIEDELYKERVSDEEEEELIEQTNNVSKNEASEDKKTFEFTFSVDSEFNQGSRYFAANGQKCHFCRNRGHEAKNCPEKEVACFLCKSDHDPLRCPANEICYNCYKMGHMRRNCPEKTAHRYCGHCQRNDHAHVECPEVWRRYVFDSPKKSKSPIRIQKYCYNCGTAGHFGDDCPTLRSFPGSKRTVFNDRAIEDLNLDTRQQYNSPPKREHQSKRIDKGKNNTSKKKKGNNNKPAHSNTNKVRRDLKPQQQVVQQSIYDSLISSTRPRK
jgi:hypothetical protein